MNRINFINKINIRVIVFTQVFFNLNFLWKLRIIGICFFLLFTVCRIQGQDKLYSNSFFLGDVKLLDSPFKKAEDLNIKTLLKYDTNRLLAPYYKAAGLPPKAANYSNWENSGLDGHIGGHYLSAIAIHFAATGNLQCKQRMDKMIAELKICQEANAADLSFIGYLGGVPNGKTLWLKIKGGNTAAIWDGWVPWYNLHKMYAGLRDAWLYGGNDEAKMMFLNFCDWGINICAKLTDAQMEAMLGSEQGGMNEVYADAYQITGDTKYLTMAKRFSHKEILNSMAAKKDNLNNKHANTQVPKAVGFQRIAEESKDATYTRAAEFFWQTVAQKRSLALGGNSRREFFPSASACSEYITDVQGPESCNTNNMLKLTEGLFRMKPNAKYADFIERALFNHILSTQHPEHGGYVYFTPARPLHYRVYSAPNKAMWCCVGTGMENHGKYGDFIYTHIADSLYLNLFIASELTWKEKGVTVTQQTLFPDEEKTQLKIQTSSPTEFSLLVRHPFWVTANSFKVIVNADTLTVPSQPSSYLSIRRTWTDGDLVEVLLPMENRLETLINVPNYVAIMHGPILLGAKTGKQDLAGLVADDSRWGHIAGGSLIALNKAPVLLGERSTFLDKIQAVKGKSLTFKTKDLFASKADSNLVLEPFFRIHDSRYMMYWMTATKAQYQNTLDSLKAAEDSLVMLNNRTVDVVMTGEQQPETDHQLKSSNSSTGVHMGEMWRDANNGYISYTMRTNKETNLSLMVRYWGNETGSRSFDILIDGVKLVRENIVGKWNKEQFENVIYPIPNTMVTGKNTIVVRFQAVASNVAGGLFNVRILRDLTTNSIKVEKSNDNLMQVFPNPTSGIVNIRINKQDKSEYQVEVLNTQSKVVLSRKLMNSESSIQINLSDFANGAYIIRYNSGTKHGSVKVIKN